MEELKEKSNTPYFGIWTVVAPNRSVLKQFETQAEAVSYVTNEGKEMIIAIDATTCTIELINPTGADTAA